MASSRFHMFPKRSVPAEEELSSSEGQGSKSETQRTPVAVTQAESSGRHSFGGCARLHGQYRTIGMVLLHLEREFAIMLPSGMLARGDARVAREFREAVTFIPVEVLESYFDDLLDSEISDERLAIAPKSWAHRLMTHLISGFGILLAVVSGLYLSASGVALPICFLLMMVLAIPFCTLLYLSVGGATRRLRFARMLSREISRRRGNVERGGSLHSTTLQGAALRLRDFLSPHPSQPAARIMAVHPDTVIH